GSALTDPACSLAQRKGSRGNQGGVFSERMARDRGRFETEFRRSYTESRDRCREKAGLRVFGESEIAFGAVEAKLLEIQLRRVRRFFEGFARGLEILKQLLRHSDVLRSLSRKKRYDLRAHLYVLTS